jgi:hypothetical protein
MTGHERKELRKAQTLCVFRHHSPTQTYHRHQSFLNEDYLKPGCQAEYEERATQCLCYQMLILSRDVWYFRIPMYKEGPESNRFSSRCKVYPISLILVVLYSQ